MNYSHGISLVVACYRYLFGPTMTPVKRSPTEVGALIRQRREQMGMRQADVPGVSAAWLGPIERGVAATSRGLSRAALMRALHWPFDGMEQLAAGVDPADLQRQWAAEIEGQEVAGDMPQPQVAASGIDVSDLTPAQRAEVQAFVEGLRRGGSGVTGGA